MLGRVDAVCRFRGQSQLAWRTKLVVEWENARTAIKDRKNEVAARQTIALVVALIIGCVLLAGIVVFAHWRAHRLVSLQGAIVVQDSDDRKELPVPGVQVSAIEKSAKQSVNSDSSGFFLIKLPEGTRRGQAIELEFRHPDYRPLNLNEFVGDKLYIVHMTPRSLPSSAGPTKRIGNVTVRYTVKSVTNANVGSAIKTFQVENRGDVPCKNRRPCSPDGKWKAALASAVLDAGAGNEFRDVRVSCIAGPCPFTRIENERPSVNSQTLSVTVRDWSDTATFLVEAEVLRSMPTEIAHQFYPVIFGKSLSFTLPETAEGVTIEADVDQQEIFFPLGPALVLSWANCNASINADQSNVYRCELKPGYRFQ